MAAWDVPIIPMGDFGNTFEKVMFNLRPPATLFYHNKFQVYVI